MPYAQRPQDPIHRAVERHRAAFDAYQIAPDGIATIEANDEYDAATNSLIETACTTRLGACVLLGHLCWWLAEEAEFSDGHQPAYSLAKARAADLNLFLTEVLPPAVIATGLPPRRGLPPTRRRLSLQRTVLKLAVVTTEAIAALVMIIGGGMLTAYASLL